MRLLTAAVASLAIALGAQAANAAPITIKFSHDVPESTPKGKMAIYFKQMVEKRLAGKVKVEIYPNSQLIDDNKVLEAELLGNVQLAAPSLSKFQKFTKKLQVFDLPFLFKDMAAVDRFQHSPKGQALLKSVSSKGLVGLEYMHNGLKQLSATKPLRVPSDAAGEKFRIMSSDVLQAQFEAVKGVPVKAPYSEVFTMLQTHAVDGQENTWTNIYSKKFYEVQPYITESNHGVLDYMVVTSKEFWNGMDPKIRTAVKKCLDEAVAYGNKLAIEQAKEDRQKIIDSGRTKLIELTPEERQQWVDAMKPVWKKFEGNIGADVIQAAVDSNK